MTRFLMLTTWFYLAACGMEDQIKDVQEEKKHEQELRKLERQKKQEEREKELANAKKDLEDSTTESGDPEPYVEVDIEVNVEVEVNVIVESVELTYLRRGLTTRQVASVIGEPEEIKKRAGYGFSWHYSSESGICIFNEYGREVDCAVFFDANGVMDYEIDVHAKYLNKNTYK